MSAELRTEEETEVSQKLRALLEARAEALAAPMPSSETDEATFLIAEFPLGDETFALPLGSLRTAFDLKKVTPVPMSAPHVVGVVRYQGHIISVLSMAALLGGRGWRQDPAVVLVVDPFGSQPIGVDCEQIPKPASLPRRLVEEAMARKQGPVVELVTPDQRAIQLIDPKVLLDRRTGGRRGH